MFERKTAAPEFRAGCEGGSTCVEVGFMAYVRDSKDPNSPVLGFTETEWRDFTAAVKRGEFDLA
ncbi:DUF397 domain-containing protein [Mangrovihabitans endophyticus]|uniref:DUF397 domain-containing protein n=1 Tax=Mangrovihabitans endophyticus TaxID=1751298 RepID=A0A8J3FN78_9ACTN|nr:DUF397 domain-containing protein [Mangrovihabitans endophyticus]GGK79205.1 hypothetical protein GCM10012284_11500 [Mangrovihabitans endophyticus]